MYNLSFFFFLHETRPLSSYIYYNIFSRTFKYLYEIRPKSSKLILRYMTTSVLKWNICIIFTFCSCSTEFKITKNKIDNVLFQIYIEIIGGKRFWRCPNFRMYRFCRTTFYSNIQVVFITFFLQSSTSNCAPRTVFFSFLTQKCCIQNYKFRLKKRWNTFYS